MKEKDYINVNELGQVKSLNRIIEGMKPILSDSIYEDEFKLVNKILHTWEARLYATINKNKSKEPWLFNKLV